MQRRSDGVRRAPARAASTRCLPARQLSPHAGLPIRLCGQRRFYGFYLFLGYGHFVSFEIVLWEFGVLREG